MNESFQLHRVTDWETLGHQAQALAEALSNAGLHAQACRVRDIRDELHERRDWARGCGPYAPLRPSVSRSNSPRLSVKI